MKTRLIDSRPQKRGGGSLKEGRRKSFFMMTLLVLFVGCSSREDEEMAKQVLARAKARRQQEANMPDSSSRRLVAARSQFENGNFAGAEVNLRAILVADPDDSGATLLLAQCEAMNGRYEEALETLTSLEDADVEVKIRSHWLACEWLLKLKRFEEAAQRYETLLALQPSNRVHRQLAKLYNSIGRRHAARIHLTALARAGDISEAELFAMNSYHQPIVGKVPMKIPKEGRLTLDALNEAKRERIEGDLRIASQLAGRLAFQYPSDTTIVSFYGLTLADLHDTQALSTWYQSLPPTIEDEPDFWHAMGSWAELEGRHTEAVRCYLETVSRDPTDRDAYRKLGQSLLAAGAITEANKVTEHYERLQKVAVLTAQLGLDAGTLEDIDRLADDLDKLGRPLEALAWREAGANGRGRSAREVEAIRLARGRLQSSPTNMQVDTVATCDIPLADWPLPNWDDLLKKLSDTKNALSGRPSSAKIVLEDVANEAGLVFRYENGDDQNEAGWYIYQLAGGGIGVLDFELDGYPDLCFSQAGGGPMQPNGSQPKTLFRNLNGKSFQEVSTSAGIDDRGYGQGVAVCDLNADGFPDLLLANIGPNVSFINNGDGTFRREAMPESSIGSEWTTSIACGDLSGDGLPEIIEVNYIDDPLAFTARCEPNDQNCNPFTFRAAIPRQYSVKADGAIVAWSGCSGLEENRAYGFAAIIANIDGLQGNDMFIANDSVENTLWASQPKLDLSEYPLRECGKLYGCAVGFLGQRQGSMGVGVGDFDRDGRLDMHVTNYWNQSADLYLQKSPAVFTNAAVGYGLYDTTRLSVAWGTQAIDLDRDGWLDFAVLNGHAVDQRSLGIPLEMLPQLFQGSPRGFTYLQPDKTKSNYWTKAVQGRTLATLDWNRDGRPDYVASHLDVPVALLENRTETGNWLQLELVGTDSERDATGAMARVTCGDDVYTGWVVGGDGFQCSNESFIDFGLGDAVAIDQVEITWPSGKTERFGSLKPNSRYLLVENDVQPHPREAR